MVEPHAGQAPHKPARRSVLVVDDDDDLRTTIAEYLRTRGFEVREARNGLEALLHVKRARPPAVVLDLAMPRLGGLDALKRIRTFDPSITVVVATGLADPEVLRQAVALGAAVVLTKPIALGDLMAALGGSEAVLPTLPEVAEIPLAATPAGTTARASAGKILVVDDEPEVRATLEEFLGQKGYQMRAAADGAAAVRAVIDEDPDIVLLDVNMPRLGGLEALTAIHAIAPTVQVIMLSGQADAELAKRTLAFGAFDYIAKPFDFAYLAQSVDAAMAIRQLGR